MADTFTHSAQLHVARPTAWTSLQDPATWAGIAGVDEIRDARFTDDGTLAGYAFTVQAGPHTVRGSATTVLVAPNSTMRIDIASAEMTGWIQATLAGEDHAPVVTVDLSMRPKGLLATMFYPLIAQAVGREFPAHVQGFADRLNAGAA